MTRNRHIFHWMIMVLLFMISLSLSAAPRLFESVAPLQYLPLICLGIAVFFTAGEFPLLLLFVFGLLIDGVHGLPLGGSSVLLVLIVPYIQLLSHSALRFSWLRIWLLFVAFLLLYQGGQVCIQFILSGDTPIAERLVMDILAAILLFPVIFATVLYFNGRGRDNMRTPL